MSKILVTVSVPAAGMARDVFIPYELRIVEITELVKAVFADEVASEFVPSGDTALCHIGGHILDADRTPEELGLLNGCVLLLI